MESPPFGSARRFPVLRRLPRNRRPLGNRLQELGLRSPEDYATIDLFVDWILKELDEREQRDLQHA